LLITDVMMPEANGRVIAKTILATRPEMKVLFTSGYTGDACIEQGELELGWPLLEKPFSRAALGEGYGKYSIQKCNQPTVRSVQS
jgi:two-component system, cell cycle sensor histidine kinase and response regulator CckA